MKRKFLLYVDLRQLCLKLLFDLFSRKKKEILGGGGCDFLRQRKFVLKHQQLHFSGNARSGPGSADVGASFLSSESVPVYSGTVRKKGSRSGSREAVKPTTEVAADTRSHVEKPAGPQQESFLEQTDVNGGNKITETEASGGEGVKHKPPVVDVMDITNAILTASKHATPEELSEYIMSLSKGTSLSEREKNAESTVKKTSVTINASHGSGADVLMTVQPEPVEPRSLRSDDTDAVDGNFNAEENATYVKFQSRIPRLLPNTQPQKGQEKNHRSKALKRGDLKGTKIPVFRPGQSADISEKLGADEKRRIMKEKSPPVGKVLPMHPISDVQSFPGGGDVEPAGEGKLEAGGAEERKWRSLEASLLQLHDPRPAPPHAAPAVVSAAMDASYDVRVVDGLSASQDERQRARAAAAGNASHTHNSPLDTRGAGDESQSNVLPNSAGVNINMSSNKDATENLSKDVNRAESGTQNTGMDARERGEETAQFDSEHLPLKSSSAPEMAISDITNHPVEENASHTSEPTASKTHGEKSSKVTGNIQHSTPITHTTRVSSTPLNPQGAAVNITLAASSAESVSLINPPSDERLNHHVSSSGGSEGLTPAVEDPLPFHSPPRRPRIGDQSPYHQSTPKRPKTNSRPRLLENGHVNEIKNSPDDVKKLLVMHKESESRLPAATELTFARNLHLDNEVETNTTNLRGAFSAPVASQSREPHGHGQSRSEPLLRAPHNGLQHDVRSEFQPSGFEAEHKSSSQIASAATHNVHSPTRADTAQFQNSFADAASFHMSSVQGYSSLPSAPFQSSRAASSSPLRNTASAVQQRSSLPPDLDMDRTAAAKPGGRHARVDTAELPVIHNQRGQTDLDVMYDGLPTGVVESSPRQRSASHQERTNVCSATETRAVGGRFAMAEQHTSGVSSHSVNSSAANSKTRFFTPTQSQRASLNNAENLRPSRFAATSSLGNGLRYNDGSPVRGRVTSGLHGDRTRSDAETSPRGADSSTLLQYSFSSNRKPIDAKTPPGGVDASTLLQYSINSTHDADVVTMAEESGVTMNFANTFDLPSELREDLTLTGAPLLFQPFWSFS